MTGAEYGRYLKQKFDQPYSTYYDDAKLNAIIAESLSRTVEKKYLQLREQKQYDELRNLIKTNISVTLVNGLLYLDALQISNATFVTAAGVVTATITTAKPHYLSNIQSVAISGVQGVTPDPNGTFTVSNITANTFDYTFAGTAGGTYITNSGIATPSNSITDYMHYLFSEILVLEDIKDIFAVKVGTETTVTTNTAHYLRTGDNTTIINTAGVTGLNQYHQNIRVLNSTKFIVGTTSGAYTGGGTVQRTQYNEARIRRSDQKGFVYTEPTNRYPKYDIGDGVLFYQPLTTQVNIDYITKIPFVIDVADTIVDLEIWYPDKFLFFLADEITQNEGTQVRDQEIQASAARAIIDNP